MKADQLHWEGGCGTPIECWDSDDLLFCIEDGDIRQMLVDAYEFGRESGERFGRGRLQQELRTLLHAQQRTESSQ